VFRAPTRLAVTAGSLLGAALALVHSGCADKNRLTPPPEVSPYLEQSSAENILKNLRTAYENQAFAEYAKLFSTDYIFVFNPVDVQDPTNPTPAQWPRADEMQAARHLFDDPRVELITLDWSPRALQADSSYGWKARVDVFNLNVYTRNDNSELWIYQVRGSWQVFYFREEDLTLPSGRKKWTCARWEDTPPPLARETRTPGAPPPEVTTWGNIKLLYFRGTRAEANHGDFGALMESGTRRSDEP
jgi:hypothetical protein